MSSTRQAGRKQGTRARVGIALALCATLIWPFSLALPFGAVHAAANPGRFVPTTALLYAEMNFQPTGGQGAAWSHLLKVITHKKGYNTAIKALLGSGMSSGDLKQVQNVTNRLGNHTGIALFQAGTASSPSANALFFIPPARGSSSPTDLLGQFKALFQTVKPAGLYYGHLLYTLNVQGAPFPGSVVDGTIILAASASRQQADHLLRAALDAGDGRAASLGSSASFGKVVASLPAQRLGYVFINSKQLLHWVTFLANGSAALKSSLGGMKPADLQKLIAQVPPAAIAMSATQRGMRIVTSAVTTPSGALRPAIVTAATAQYAGPDALTYMSFAGLGDALLQSFRTADKTAGVTTGTGTDLLHSTLGVGAIEKQLHLNIEHDVLPLLNGELGLSLSVQPGVTQAANPFKMIQARVALRLTNAAKTGQVMAKVNTWIGKQTGLQWRRISPTTRGMQEPSLGVGYKLSDQWMFVGTGINEHWSGGLNTTQGFNEALTSVADNMPGGLNRPTALIYFNIDPLASLLQETMTGSSLTTYNREAKPLLSSLHSLTMAARVTPDGRQSAALFVGIH